jgi:hypothetical protein
MIHVGLDVSIWLIGSLLFQQTPRRILRKLEGLEGGICPIGRLPFAALFILTANEDLVPY